MLAIEIKLHMEFEPLYPAGFHDIKIAQLDDIFVSHLQITTGENI
jgi:hypothetical protein